MRIMLVLMLEQNSSRTTHVFLLFGTTARDICMPRSLAPVQIELVNDKGSGNDEGIDQTGTQSDRLVIGQRSVTGSEADQRAGQ